MIGDSVLPAPAIAADPCPGYDLSDLLVGLVRGGCSATGGPHEGNLCNAALSLLLIFWWRLEHLSSIVAQLLQTYPVGILDTSMQAPSSEARWTNRERDCLKLGLASSRLLFFCSPLDRSSPQLKQ